MWCRRINSLVLSSALFAAASPALAQQLPPQPPEFGAAQQEWAQAQENWLKECTQNQFHGNRERAEAREFCKAYLANYLGYGSSNAVTVIVVPASATGGNLVGRVIGGDPGIQSGGGYAYTPQRPPMPSLSAAPLDAARCPPARRH